MPIFIKEDRKETLKTKVSVPNKLVNKMVQNSNYYDKVAPQLQGVKRANKIASAAKKEQYNTDEKKYSETSDGVTLNANEIKRWKNALDNLPPNSDAYEANGGDLAKSMVDGLNKEIRRRRHEVPEVKEVDKLVKDTKVDKNSPKPIKVNKAQITVHEGKKTIYINENKLNLLKEVYSQLELPFDQKYRTVNGKTVSDKMAYQFYMDWIEHIGRYGNLHSNFSPKQILLNLMNKDGFMFKLSNNKSIIDNLNREYNLDTKDLMDWENDFEWETFLEDEYFIFDATYEEFEEEYLDTVIKLFDSNYDEIEKYIRPSFYQKRQEFFEDAIKNIILREEFLPNLQIKNNLIYVERSISLPTLTGYYSSDDYDDYYQELNGEYSGVGKYWSFKEGNAIAYNGDIENENGANVILKGYVRCEDIDWYETIINNLSSLKYETDITLKNNGFVNVYEIIVENSDTSSKLPLNRPIILPV